MSSREKKDLANTADSLRREMDAIKSRLTTSVQDSESTQSMSSAQIQALQCVSAF